MNGEPLDDVFERIKALEARIDEIVASTKNACPDDRLIQLESEVARIHSLLDSDVLRVGKCQKGQILGFALVQGSDAMPHTYSQDTAYLQLTYNCSGEGVEVRREAEGLYYVRFINNMASLAVASVSYAGPVDFATAPVVSSVTRLTQGHDAGSFRVVLRTLTVGARIGDLQLYLGAYDGPFQILMP